ncbi:hypothetical protein MUU72_05160 [Streptomyces sp. RS10V-4]|uniref:hypothetical protein n=1 Tax=Streptomyces rhizoryzae TaxID=2932493 RepID=UPI00200663E1|nr:hypothetical protein [Streptomyces rhizoryzae]MCK7622502.1 hypothetical protein [Streptomyces rhizoryzae]
MPPTPRLLVADHVAGSLRVLNLPDGSQSSALTGRHLAEHAGFLVLPGARAAFVDDRAGELVVLDPYGPDAGRPLTEATVPVAVPAEHLAADPTGRRLAVTTGLGRNHRPWSDLLTAIDLHAPGHPDAVRIRTRPGEPGVTVLGTDDPLVVLRHREPGQFTAYRHTALMAAAPSCPPTAPHTTLPLADDDAHGDAHDPHTERLFAAAGSGVHRARHRAGRLVPESPLPWGGPGRGYYLRLDPVRRLLWSGVRSGPPHPGRWPDWDNHAWWHHLDTGRTGRVPLGPGLVFRLAVAARHVAYARVHPDGDELILLAPGPGPDPRIAARIPLPPMAGAPRPGDTPWDGVQRRALAASPASSLIAVTRGGHGEIELLDADHPHHRTTLTVPTPLEEGGHLALLCPDDPACGDPVGR